MQVENRSFNKTPLFAENTSRVYSTREAAYKKEQAASSSSNQIQTIKEDEREGKGRFVNMLAGEEKNSAKSRNLTDLTKTQKAGLEKAKQNLEIQKVVAQLKSTDTRVRTHEAAHMGAGGGLITRGASFTYQTGPDGKQYAVGGEVGIDTSPVSDNPEATITKMQQVRAAALAPANPSSQDLSVAAAASAMEAQAAAELVAKGSENSNAENS